MILVRYIEFQYLDTGCMERQRIREEDWLLRLWGKLTSKSSVCHVRAHGLRMLPLSAPCLSRELTATDYPLYAHTSESSDRSANYRTSPLASASPIPSLSSEAGVILTNHHRKTYSRRTKPLSRTNDKSHSSSSSPSDLLSTIVPGCLLAVGGC